MNSNKKSKFSNLLIFNKYIMIFIFIFFLFTTGMTYAYFAFQVENTSVITGNVIAIDADLNVELVVGNNGKLVPMDDEALSNAIKGVGSTNGACIDTYGNLSCQVYKITLTNNGSRLKHLTGSIELYAKDGEGNVYNNLKWRELTNTTTIKDGSILNGMSKSTLVTDLTMQSKEEKVWYVAVWLSEQDYDQLDTDKGLFGGTVTFADESGGGVAEDGSGINAPNLDGGNLIPVYFDETVGTYGSWMKADSSNANNSWYDYNNRMWANAVIVDPSKLETYQKTVKVGDPITDADIIAFYVWIPRFKYRVWNINRQGTLEDYYAYPAFTNGIQIEFEKGTASTGNVTCNYDVVTNGSATYLSDNCSVNGTAVAYDTANSTYGDSNPAWYTHPAFTFGDGTDKNKTGFWIGKFETSTITTSTCYTTPNATNCNNTNQEPRILPDVSSLRNQAVSNQFMTAVKFQGYLSSNVDAHMLTNLEWGAVAYLTHSIYGLCDGSSCGGVYINNSCGDSCYFTGRSGGAIAGSSELNLVNAYGSSVTTSTDQYNCNGYYDYKGYKLDYSTGNPTTKDITKIASTTGNITGVYDMSGGSYEYVMGNMVDTSDVFYPAGAGSAWSSTNWYDTVNSSLYSKYYNAYAYATSESGAKAFNRSRLGDATAEVLGGTSTTSSWKPGAGGAIAGSQSHFVYLRKLSRGDKPYPWFYRGGHGGLSDNTFSGSFGFSTSYAGSYNSYHSFRSSLT